MLSHIRPKMYAQQQLGYAPTPYSYTPSNNLTATINLDEVRFHAVASHFH